MDRRTGFEMPEPFIQVPLGVTPPLGAHASSSLAGRAVGVATVRDEPRRRAEAAGLALPRLTALYSELKRLTAC